MNDQPEVVFPRIEMTLEGMTEPTCSLSFKAEVSCPMCNPDLTYVEREPDYIPPTVPECTQNIEGTVLTNSYEDEWSVPYKFYRLTKVKLWHYGTDTSGFEVTFEAPAEYEGWEPITRTFGFEDGTTEEEVNLTYDLEEIEICVDKASGDSDQDSQDF